MLIIRNLVSFQLYVKSTVKMKKTVLDYTWVSMLAEIGGYTGLLLGVSVVNVTRYVDKILLRYCKKRRRKRKEKNKWRSADALAEGEDEERR